MKIAPPPAPNQPSQGPAPAAVGAGDGKEFAGKLARVESANKAEQATLPSESVLPAGVSVSDIGAELKAGQISPQVAIDRVVERVLDRQLGTHTSATVRASLEATLRDRLADDPLLASKMRALLED
jgi:hypothetical protein